MKTYRIYVEEVFELEATSETEAEEIYKMRYCNEEWETKAEFVGDSVSIKEQKDNEGEIE